MRCNGRSHRSLYAKAWSVRGSEAIFNDFVCTSSHQLKLSLTGPASTLLFIAFFFIRHMLMYITNNKFRIIVLTGFVKGIRKEKHQHEMKSFYTDKSIVLSAILSARYLLCVMEIIPIFLFCASCKTTFQI